MLSSTLQFFDRRMAARRRRAAQRLALDAVQAFPTIIEKGSHGLDTPLVISLTSYAKRFGTLSYTIKSLLDQDVQYDRLILWVGRDDYDLLPSDVQILEGDIFEVRVTTDIRSYTKLIPALREFPEAYIVTADDDIHYPTNWLSTILRGYVPGRRMTVCRRAHMALVDGAGVTTSYASWPHSIGDQIDPGSGRALFPTGVGGVLYPPSTFSEEVLNETAFIDLCPFADDIWFFWMQLINNVERRRVGSVEKFVTWPSTQETGLLNDNLHLGRNDSQLLALERRYGKLESFIGRVDPD